MLTQFLAHNATITPYSGDFNTSAHWNRREDTLPLGAKIDGVSYFLVGDSSGEAVILYNAADIVEAVKISLETVDAARITFTEWVRIYEITGGRFHELPLNGIAKKETALIKGAKDWPGEIKDYLEKKPPAISVIKLISLFDANQRNLIKDYIRKEAPSVQQFKGFVEKVRDFNIQLNIYDAEAFISLTERRSPLHIHIDSLLKSLPFASHTDSFETSSIKWSFSAANIAEYRRSLEKLAQSESKAAELFSLLSEKDD